MHSLLDKPWFLIFLNVFDSIFEPSKIYVNYKLHFKASNTLLYTSKLLLKLLFKEDLAQECIHFFGIF